MHHFDAPKIEKGLLEWKRLVALREDVEKIRDMVDQAASKRLCVTIAPAEIPDACAAPVELSKTIKDELHTWLVDRLTEEVRLVRIAHERVVTPAGQDLHAKNGKTP